MTLATPTYDIARSYDENYEAGPVFAGPLPPVPASSRKRTVLGFELASPLGIPAGPLLNAAYVDFYGKLGWDVPVYKTVRSIARACHPAPNCLFIAPDPLSEDDAHSIRATTPAPPSAELVAITNSFGMPSKTPDEWGEDVRRAAASLGPDQLLIVSVVGTPGAEGRSLVEDFAHTAALAKAHGARAIEANLSCPNVVSGEGSLYADPASAAAAARAIKREIGDVPLLIKIGALPEERLREVADAVREWVAGIALINTVPLRVVDAAGEQALPGEGRLKSGVCGAAIGKVGRLMTERLLRVRDELGAEFVVVSVGGVMTEADIDDRLALGADLVMSATGAMWDPLLARRWRAATADAR